MKSFLTNLRFDTVPYSEMNKVLIRDLMELLGHFKLCRLL